MKQLQTGEAVPLDPAQAHHARDVLRLVDGAAVEVFDDAGAVGIGVLRIRGQEVAVQVERSEAAAGAVISLTIAAAVPKGDRADWMVEKLSELGVASFVPLAAARSVVLPEGRGKRERWNRIATEAAKQSRRAGVMRIGELTSVADALREKGVVWFLSTERADAIPVMQAVRALDAGAGLSAFIGPEGGWTADEVRQFLTAGATPVRLTQTILRIETAAVTTAAVMASLDAPVAANDHPPSKSEPK